MMSDWFNAEEVADDVYRIREEPYRDTANMYLLVGDEKDVLIDTGTGLYDISLVVEELSDKPKTVVNTHPHFDHAGGNGPFNTVHIHESAAQILKNPTEDATLSFILEHEPYVNQSFTAPVPETEDYEVPAAENVWRMGDGGRLHVDRYTLDIIHTPGHSPSDIVLHEKDQGYLFTGDTLYGSDRDDAFIGPLLWSLSNSDITQYVRSLKKLHRYDANIDLALPGHGPVLEQDAYVDTLNAATSALRSAHVNNEFQRIQNLAGNDAPRPSPFLYHIDRAKVNVVDRISRLMSRE